MTDKNLDNTLDHSLDCLETAFSDSTRKLVRQIKTEWQRLMKYKSDVSAKENELLTAKEKIAHLNERKIQNEKYLDVTVKRLENLRLSKVQLKGKLSNLKKEEERVAKSCSETEGHMYKKIAIYKEKWQKRYESHYSKNPKILEKERNMKTMEELRQKLCALNDEYQKYEKELFQAKCERNKMNIDRSKFFPFNNFVVAVAKIYLDIKNTYGQCEVISKEITLIDNNITQLKAKYETAIKSKVLQNSENTQHASLNLQATATDETNIVEQNLCINNESNTDNDTISVQRVDSFQNDFVNSDDNMLNQVNFSNNVNTQNNLCIKEVDNTNEVQPKMSKVRKWMEKLKIVSKFTITEENEKHDSKNSSILVKISKDNKTVSNTLNVSSHDGTKDIEISERSDPLNLIKSRESNTGNSDNQIMEQPTRNIDTNINRIASGNFVSPTACNNNTSKYFRKCNSAKPKENWNLVPSKKKMKKSTSVVKDNTKQKILENEMVVDEQTSENKNNLQKTADKFPDEMDVDEEMKGDNAYSNNNAYDNLQDKTMKKNLHEDIYMTIPKENWDIVPSKKEMKKSTSFVEGNPTQMLENEMVVDEQLSENGSNLQQRAIPDVMDVDEEMKEDKACSINAYENLQDKTLQKKLHEGSFYEIRSNKEEETATSHLKDTEANVDSSNSNNNNEKDNPIQSDKMDVDESVREVPHDAQNCTYQNITVSNAIVPTQNIHQATPEKPSPLHNLNLEHTLITHEENNNKSSTENIHNGPNIENLNTQKGPNINTASSASTSMIPTPLTAEQTPKSNESVPKTPSRESNPHLRRQIAHSEESNNSTFIPFKPESISPGFAYTSRLMYQAIASTSGNQSSPTPNKDLQTNVFSPMTFFNVPRNNLELVQSPESDKIEFLASAYEDYLADSPPMIKGTEKSMFAFAEDSPDKEGKDDFFPLFGADNGQSNKDTQDNGAQFTFNFCSSSKEESPNESSGFKFLF